MKSIKTLIGTGIVGLVSLLTIGPKVRAAMPNALPKESEDDLGMSAAFSIEPVNAGLVLDQRLQSAIDRARLQHSRQQLQNGVFTFSPDGELQWVSKRSDIQKAKEELIRMRLKSLYAGGVTPTTEC